MRYRPYFLYVIMNFIGLKITFSNMGSHGALSWISGGWPKWPPPHLAENLKRPLDRVNHILFGSSLCYKQVWDQFFCNQNWFQHHLLLSLIVVGPEYILHQKFSDMKFVDPKYCFDRKHLWTKNCYGLKFFLKYLVLL